MKTTLSTLTETIQNARAQIKKEGGEAFYREYKPLFEKAPDIKAIKWSQYTPYFNDGDTCEFGVNGLEFDVSADADADGDDFKDSYYLKGEQKKIAEEFDRIHGSVDSDLFLSAFDDHSEITITRDGKVTVDGYDHE